MSPPLTQDLFQVCIRGQAARAGQTLTSVQYSEQQRTPFPCIFYVGGLGGLTGGLESWPGEFLASSSGTGPNRNMRIEARSHMCIKQAVGNFPFPPHHTCVLQVFEGGVGVYTSCGILARQMIETKTRVDMERTFVNFRSNHC